MIQHTAGHSSSALCRSSSAHTLRKKFVFKKDPSHGNGVSRCHDLTLCFRNASPGSSPSRIESTLLRPYTESAGKQQPSAYSCTFHPNCSRRRGGGEERRGRAEASCTPTHQFIQPASCRANFVGLLPTLVRANNGSARRARGFLTKGRIRAKLGSKVASMLDDGDGEDGVEGRRAQGREGGYLVRFRLRRVRSEAEETTRQHVIAPCSTLGCR